MGFLDKLKFLTYLNISTLLGGITVFSMVRERSSSDDFFGFFFLFFIIFNLLSSAATSYASIVDEGWSIRKNKDTLEQEDDLRKVSPLSWKWAARKFILSRRFSNASEEAEDRIFQLLVSHALWLLSLPCLCFALAPFI